MKQHMNFDNMHPEIYADFKQHPNDYQTVEQMARVEAGEATEAEITQENEQAIAEWEAKRAQ